MVVTLGQQYNIGEKPTVTYCTLTLIAMQGHQKNSEDKLMKLYSILVYKLLFTQAPIPVCLDGTIIDIISTILVTMYYYCGYVGV